MSKTIEFPDLAPKWLFDRDALKFYALVNGRTVVTCLVSGEALMEHFGAKKMTGEEAIRAFEQNKAEIQDAARQKIEEIDVGPGTEFILTMASFPHREVPKPRLRATYTDDLEKESKLKQWAVNACYLIADYVFPQAHDVTAEWSLVLVSNGEKLVNLNLVDNKTQASVQELFAAEIIENRETTKDALARVGTELLRAVNHKLLKRLLSPDVTEA